MTVSIGHTGRTSAFCGGSPFSGISGGLRGSHGSLPEAGEHPVQSVRTLSLLVPLPLQAGRLARSFERVRSFVSLGFGPLFTRNEDENRANSNLNGHLARGSFFAPRLQLRQKSLRRVRETLHASCVAPAFHKQQKTTGVSRGIGSIDQPRGNLSQGQSNG